jgi:hypothetical protein
MGLEVRGEYHVYQRGVDQGLIRRPIRRGCITALGTLIHLDKISEAELKIVADAMWGAGATRFGIITAAGQRMQILNPGFGGIIQADHALS